MATIIYKYSRTYRKKSAFLFYDFLKQQSIRNYFLTIAVNSMSMSGGYLQKVCWIEADLLRIISGCSGTAMGNHTWNVNYGLDER